MSIYRWNPRDPWAEMKRVQEEMERVFRNFSGEGLRGVAGLFPAINLCTDEKSATLRCEMPGVAPEQVDVSVHQNSVTIKGERTLKQKGGEVSYHRRERSGGVFNRTVNLPFEVDPERSRATYANGVLEVTIERAARTLPRQITIQAGN